MPKPKKGMLDFEAMFDLWANDTQKTWAHDRSQSVGASEVFGCLRKAWFGKRGAAFGYKPDADFVQSWGATKRGDLIENHLVVPAVSLGLKAQAPMATLLYAGEEQETIIEGRASATPDGLIVDVPPYALQKYGIEDIESDCFTLEIKSIDPRVNLSEEKAVHRGQVQMQMGLIRDTTKYRPNYAVILYIDASFHDKITPFIIKYDQKVYEAGKKRADNVWKIDDPKKIAPEGKFDKACDYCPYQQACSMVTLGSVPVKDDAKKLAVDDDEELAELIAAYREKKKQADRADHDFEVVKQAIKDRLAEKGKSRVWGEDYKVSWTTQAGRKTLDKEAMIEDGIDISKYEKEGSGFDKLTITLAD
jgi:CRISPR/Cas system-associated exonuclease Cas4 (RecB family)